MEWKIKNLRELFAGRSMSKRAVPAKIVVRNRSGGYVRGNVIMCASPVRIMCACGIDIATKSDQVCVYAYKYFATRSAPQKKAVNRETPWPDDSEITPSMNLSGTCAWFRAQR